MKGNQRIVLILAAVVVAVAAFVVISPGGDDDGEKSATTTPATAPPATTDEETTSPTETATTPPAPAAEVTEATIRVVGAKPQGGVRTINAHKGDRLRITVISDTADEIHIHGYDLAKDVTAGGTVRFSFKATIEGVFEAELEDRKAQIAKLVVEP